MSSASYWEKRKAQEMFEYMEKAEDAADDIAKLYQKASGYLSAELDKIFERYKRKHHLTDAEAYRLLNSLHDKTSIDELKKALRGGSGAEKDILAELESPAYQARLERLQQLQNQLDLTMQEVYKQEKAINTSHYVDLANEAYYRSIFDIQQRTGLGFSFNLVDPAVIDRVINSKWSGANYSTRIWRNTQSLAQNLKEELLVNLVTGRTDREVAEIIANKYAQGASNARRLVRTESCNLANQMEMQSYEECGIETYIYVATLDLRTSAVCRGLDRKRFPVAEQQPGKNCPPMHPWCRSTTICDITDEELAQMTRWARDPVTGRSTTVPANMTYEQWYDKNVRGNPQAETNEKMIRNRSEDRRQYERYKAAMGKDYVPSSLNDFQKIKYGSGDEYGILKAQAKGMTYYNKALGNEPDITAHVKQVASQSGMNMAGLEYRVKSKDSYLTKIRRKYDPAGNQYEVKDILRYTYTAPSKELVNKTLNAFDIHDKSGYNIIEVNNYWMDKNNPYNGINTTLRSANGQAFEVQYHTPESFEIKNGEMHKLYEKQRLIKDVHSKEYIELTDKMFELSDSMEVPLGIERVKSHE